MFTQDPENPKKFIETVLADGPDFSIESMKLNGTHFAIFTTSFADKTVELFIFDAEN